MRKNPGTLTVPDLPISAADTNFLDSLLQPRLALFWGANTPTQALLSNLTILAADGHAIRIFDGGNRFDGYFVARLARRLSSNPREVLERIRLSRAFTCFQLAQLIENAPASAQPLFVLDLLTTFYDESVPLRDSERLLATAIAHLKRLAAVGPVIVGAREPLDRIQIASDVAWLLRTPEGRPPVQPQLF